MEKIMLQQSAMQTSFNMDKLMEELENGKQQYERQWREYVSEFNGIKNYIKSYKRAVDTELRQYASIGVIPEHAEEQ
jgi:gamma-glutamylcysteine synthetase